jgi:hypothetical protein
MFGSMDGRNSAGEPVIDTTVAHSARVHDYWLGGKDNFAADRAAGDAVMAAYPGIVTSVRANRETQRHRAHAEVSRFFEGLELVEPGVVAVPRWRPASETEAAIHSAMWGGVARKL